MKQAWDIHQTMNDPTINRKDKHICHIVAVMPPIVVHGLFIEIGMLFKAQLQSIGNTIHILQLIMMSKNSLLQCLIYCSLGISMQASS
jgi:hypothetical protein